MLWTCSTKKILNKSVRLVGISMGKLNNEKATPIKQLPVSVQLHIDF